MMTLEHKLLHAVTEYDRKQSAKQGYNPYALSHYLGAINERILPAIAEGKSTRQAILGAMCGQLANICLKVAGEPRMTDAEKRGSLADYGY